MLTLAILALKYTQEFKMITTCEKCGYTVTHTKNLHSLDNFPSFAGAHYTCLCMLFEHDVICCVKGYSNLLNNVPMLAIYSSLPTQSYQEWSQWTQLGTTVDRSQADGFVKSCVEVKKSILNSIYNPYFI